MSRRLTASIALRKASTFSRDMRDGRLGQVRFLGRLEAGHLGGAAGQAGTRERPRGLALGLALGLGRLRAGLRDHRLLTAEDLFLRLALQQLDELLALDRLAADQDLGE